MNRRHDAGIRPWVAGALVAFSSGAVLVLEILSLRLVAPYVGLSLQTSTAVIGFALAAIATGAWVGGRTADRVSPERALGPTLAAAGVLVLFVGPLVRWTGELVAGGAVPAVLLITAVAVFAPAALLSAVTPMVVKLRLGTLAETGSVVGRLSGIATLGALVATFGTGFLLVATVPTTVVLLVLGGALVVVGLLSIFRRGLIGVTICVVTGAALGGIASVATPSPCDVETAYHCARVVTDPTRPSGRTLQLDTLSHSYIDVADPTYLRFSYVRGLNALVDATSSGPLRALHLGGGGLTFPRYLHAARRGSEHLVMEIDGGVVDVAVDRLGVELDENFEVRVQDARVGLAREPADARDLVVGDAFAGLSVPWHLTTKEAVADVRRVLRDDGIYIVNVIDYPPLAFARAEVATIGAVFPHVALAARPPVLARRDGGNLLIVGSERPLDVDVLRDTFAERVPEYGFFASPSDVAAFAGDARILTDDFAPVDQLLTPYPGPDS